MIDLGFVTIDFTPLLEAATNPLTGFWYLFVHGGWLIILITLLWGAKELWLYHIQNAYYSKWQWVLLSINVPRENEQSPKAVEHIFTQIAGARSGANLIEKYIQGKIQEVFSFEIVSQEGFIRFYVRTPKHFRDLIEAAFYAQYPDAEILEVEDYVDFAPDEFPNEEYDLWGTEFSLTNKYYFPIRTYSEFEHRLSQEFKDPMAALLEAMGKIGPGEHIWLQFIIQPIDNDWKEAGVKAIEKLTKGKLTSEGAESILPMLSPVERKLVEAIQAKISKIGFAVKFRMIYLGKKGVFHKGRGVAPITGAIMQYNTLDLNGFKPTKSVTTKIDYFFVKKRTAWRQSKIIKSYKNRSFMRGATPIILNVEELATIFHFPTKEVRAPSLAVAVGKKAEPPSSLPIEIFEPEPSSAKPTSEKKSISQELEPPENLPVA